MYKVLRSILFLFDAEKVHHFSMNVLKLLCRTPLIRLIRQIYKPKDAANEKRETKNGQTKKKKQETIVFNLCFKNPIGLAAGFDKNAKYLRELEALGFGFVEIGTVTPLPQDGNPKPRLFRLPKDKALINRMGFNNDGAEVIAKRLKNWHEERDTGKHKSGNQLETKNSKLKTIIGGNIGKNKTTANKDAHEDYLACFKSLHAYVDYFVVNVSSPNTPGLRELQEKESLRKILVVLQTENTKKEIQRPILLKISPDLSDDQIDDVISLVSEISLDGLVVANTTLSRDNLKTTNPMPGKVTGGLSGAPLRRRANELVHYIHEKSGKPIIASGGIFTGGDAIEILGAGASLLQVWTGFIYEGPGIVKKISRVLNHP